MLIPNNAEIQSSSCPDLLLPELLDPLVSKERWLASKASSQEVALVAIEVALEAIEVASEGAVEASETEAVSLENI